MNKDCLRVLRHIIEAEIDRSWDEEAIIRLRHVQECIEAAVAGDYTKLVLLDEFLTKEEEMED